MLTARRGIATEQNPIWKRNLHGMTPSSIVGMTVVKLESLYVGVVKAEKDAITKSHFRNYYFHRSNNL